MADVDLTGSSAAWAEQARVVALAAKLPSTPKVRPTRWRLSTIDGTEGIALAMLRGELSSKKIEEERAWRGEYPFADLTVEDLALFAIILGAETKQPGK